MIIFIWINLFLCIHLFIGGLYTLFRHPDMGTRVLSVKEVFIWINTWPYKIWVNYKDDSDDDEEGWYNGL